MSRIARGLWLASVVQVSTTGGCAAPSSAPHATSHGKGGCRRDPIEHVTAPRIAQLRQALDRGAYPLPGGDRDLQNQIDDLAKRAAGCEHGDADDCQNLAVIGDSRELFSCAIEIWRTECDAATARACLRLSDAYSTTYYMPSLRPFPADPARALELYVRGTTLYDEACEQGNVEICRTMAFEPAVMAREPARAVAVLVRLCDRGDGQACSDAGSHPATVAAERAHLWERGCYASKPSGMACATLANVPEEEARRAELEKRACQLDARTCTRAHVEAPP